MRMINSCLLSSFSTLTRPQVPVEHVLHTSHRAYRVLGSAAPAPAPSHGICSNGRSLAWPMGGAGLARYVYGTCTRGTPLERQW